MFLLLFIQNAAEAPTNEIEIFILEGSLYIKEPSSKYFFVSPPVVCVRLQQASPRPTRYNRSKSTLPALYTELSHYLSNGETACVAYRPRSCKVAFQTPPVLQCGICSPCRIRGDRRQGQAIESRSAEGCISLTQGYFARSIHPCPPRFPNGSSGGICSLTPSIYPCFPCGVLR